jgi:hypothetical protein
MIATFFRTAPLFLALTLSLSPMREAHAIDPDSVDIDLRRSTLDTNSLEIYIRANGQPFGDVLSGLTFTIRWVTTSPATLGPRVNTCPSGIPISATAQETNPMVDSVPTGYNYRSYNAFGTSLLSDEGCPLPQDEWFLVMTVAVENIEGCTEFNIVNDSWTNSPGNARDYFVSLGGFDLTGAIEPTSAFIGACAADCLGNVGGTALPGTPCDDGNPETENDLFNDECVCAGIPMGLTENTNGSIVMNLHPNPSVHGSVLLHMEGIASADERMAAIDVFDAIGKRVISERANIVAGVVHHRLDPGSVGGAGVYMVKVTIGSQQYSQRLVIQ